jgi:hypothetical protein
VADWSTDFLFDSGGVFDFIANNNPSNQWEHASWWADNIQYRLLKTVLSTTTKPHVTTLHAACRDSNTYQTLHHPL